MPSRITWVIVPGLMVLMAVTCCEESGDDYLEMRIQSAAFGQEEAIPTKFACEKKVNPPLSFSEPPDGTKSLAVIMDEPEYINGTFTRWLIWGLPPKTVIPEDASKYPPEGAIFGTADDEKETVGYLGPCTPEGETHRFVFQVYALDKKIKLKEGSKRDALDAAMAGHILAKGELVGLVIGK